MMHASPAQLFFTGFCQTYQPQTSDVLTGVTDVTDVTRRLLHTQPHYAPHDDVIIANARGYDGHDFILAQVRAAARAPAAQRRFDHVNNLFAGFRLKGSPLRLVGLERLFSEHMPRGARELVSIPKFEKDAQSLHLSLPGVGAFYLYMKNGKLMSVVESLEGAQRGDPLYGPFEVTGMLAGSVPMFEGARFFR